MHARHDDLACAAVHRQIRWITSTDPAHESASAPAIGPAGAVATVLRLQYTCSNQAMQRLLQRDDELFPTPTLGDWKFEPPKPTTETDTTYDTEDEKRRAEQKAADERGESQKPDEWWKDKPRQPKPTDPKDYSDLDKWRSPEAWQADCRYAILRSCGSRTSRSQSPIRLIARTVSTIARPGIVASHQAVAM